MTVTDVQKGFDEASTGFKQMQTVLIIYCGLVTLALLVITIKLIKDETAS